VKHSVTIKIISYQSCLKLVCFATSAAIAQMEERDPCKFEAQVQFLLAAPVKRREAPLPPTYWRNIMTYLAAIGAAVLCVWLDRWINDE
jgi:hypothetical protein